MFYYVMFLFVFDQIMFGIFSSDVTFAATKPQPLLPSGMIKDIEIIKRWISDYLINIHQIIRDYTSSFLAIRSKKPNATEIRKIIIEQLQNVLKTNKNEFREALSMHFNHNNKCNNVIKYGQESKQEPISLLPHNYYNDITPLIETPQYPQYPTNVSIEPPSYPQYPQHPGSPGFNGTTSTFQSFEGLVISSM